MLKSLVEHIARSPRYAVPVAKIPSFLRARKKAQLGRAYGMRSTPIPNLNAYRVPSMSDPNGSHVVSVVNFDKAWFTCTCKHGEVVEAAAPDSEKMDQWCWHKCLVLLELCEQKGIDL